MLEKLRRHILICGSCLCEFECYRKHGEAIESHPGRPICLLQIATGGKGPGSVKNTDIIQTKKTSGENVIPLGVLAIHPPGEIEKQFVKDAFKEISVSMAVCAAYLVDSPGSPGVHRRIDVGKCEFICGNLPIWVHVPFTKEKLQLLLGKLWIEMCKREHVKRQIPCCEPGIFPLVRHRDDIAAEYLKPIMIASLPSGCGRCCLERVPF